MKRKMWTIIFICLIFTVGSAAASGLQYRGFPVVRLVINGKEIQSDVPPIVMDGRTLLPVRPIADALGVSVAWDPSSQTISLSSSASGGYLVIKSDADYQQWAAASPADLAGFRGVILVLGFRVIITDARSFLAASTGRMTFDQLLATSQVIDTTPSPQKPQQTTSSSPQQKDQIWVYSGNSTAFLGIFSSDQSDPNSICNPVGKYGSPTSSTSIFNPNNGAYASWNDILKNGGVFPPYLVKNGKAAGRITVNLDHADDISPYGICDRLKQLGL